MRCVANLARNWLRSLRVPEAFASCQAEKARMCGPKMMKNTSFVKINCIIITYWSETKRYFKLLERNPPREGVIIQN